MTRAAAALLACVCASLPAQDAWTAAKDAARSERLAYEAETVRLAAARRALTDRLRAETLQETEAAEAAEEEAARLAAAAEAEAFGLEVAERRAIGDEAEASTWRDSLARRAGELERATGTGARASSPRDAAVLDAALDAALRRRSNEAAVRIEGGSIVVGDIQRFTPRGPHEAIGGKTGDDRLSGPWPCEGVGAEFDATSEGRPPAWFPLDPSGRLRSPEPVAESSFAAKLESGGPIVFAILALGALAAVLAAWRGISLARTSGSEIASTARAREWLGAGAASEPEAALERVAARAESAFLKLQTFFATVVAAAPLLGLLGTVTGMIRTFQALPRSGGGDVGALSGGIAEALVTTEAGLWVAIPMLLVHALLGARARRLIDATEEAAERIVAESRRS